MIYATLAGVATLTRSNTGEAGAIVLASVLAIAILIERRVFRTRTREALANLGFVRSSRVGTTVGLVTVAALVIVLASLALTSKSGSTLRPGWPFLVAGLFLQGGLAEELAFRGFLFRRFRAERTFWRAAALSTVPFVFAHLYLYWTMPPIVATTAVAVAVSTSFPLARLFEVSGGSIWPCAAVHCSTHLVKIVAWPEDSFLTVQLAWMTAVMLVLWCVFFFRKPLAQEDGPA